MRSIAVRRLHAQGLAGAGFVTPVQAVERLGAVQAQDYAGAKWGLAQRVGGATEADLDRLFDEGAVLRTHVMRPTWHLVLPRDVRWLLRLTAPRVKQKMSYRDRVLGVDGSLLAKAYDVVTSALQEGAPLTRAKLTAALAAGGIDTGDGVFAHVLVHAELDALVVSGPRRGAQHTWMLLDDRAPHAVAYEPERDEALGQLARRYFGSHGPARLADFSWWSGLTLADVRRAVEVAGPALAREEIDGVTHLLAADAEPAPRTSGAVHLLPNYDELTVGYSDRSALMPGGDAGGAWSGSDVLGPVITVDGVVHGRWSARRRGGVVEVAVEVPHGLPAPPATALRRRIADFERFRGSSGTAGPAPNADGETAPA